MFNFQATPINNDYHYGMLGEFKLIIRSKDNYVNITKLCTDGGKRFCKWKENEKSRGFLKFFDERYMACFDDTPTSGCRREYKCLDVVTQSDLEGNTNENIQVIQGTYVHMDVAIYVAQWVSDDFAVKVSSIVRGYYNHSLYLKTVDLQEKNDELTAKMNALLEKIDRMQLKNEETVNEMKRDSERKEMIMSAIREEARVEREVAAERHSELKSIISTAMGYISKEKGTKREILLIYRLKSEATNKLHIHAGRRDSFKIPKPEECKRFFIGEHISNAKRTLRFLKEQGFIPSSATTTEIIVASKRQRDKLFDVVSGIDEEYKKIATKA